MKAKLVTVQLTVRVIVPDGASQEYIWDISMPKFIDRLKSDAYLDNVTNIEDDLEVPFGDLKTDNI